MNVHLLRLTYSLTDMFWYFMFINICTLKRHHFSSLLFDWLSRLLPSRWSLTQCERSGICFISCARLSWPALRSNSRWKTQCVLWLKPSNQRPLWRSGGMPATPWGMLSETQPCRSVSVCLSTFNCISLRIGQNGVINCLFDHAPTKMRNIFMFGFMRVQIEMIIIVLISNWIVNCMKWWAVILFDSRKCVCGLQEE